MPRKAMRTRVMLFIVPASAARLAAALDSPRRPNTALKTVRPVSTSGSPFTGEYLVDERRHQQDDLHQVFVLTQERLPSRLLFLIRQMIRAILLQALLHLSRAQAPGRIDLEPVGDFRRRKRVPLDI